MQTFKSEEFKMNNPTDKNGNIINIGDRVVYSKGTPEEDYGVVTSFATIYGEIRPYAKWIDGSVLHCDPKDIEVEISAITTDTFTGEDEALLQVLLAKKEKADNLRNTAIESMNKLANQMYKASHDATLCVYLQANIDSICDTLQAYKRIVNNRKETKCLLSTF